MTVTTRHVREPGTQRESEVRARYAGMLCALCGLEHGEPVRLVPTHSFTESNVLPIGPLCQELLRRREPSALLAVRRIVHDDDRRYALLADDLDSFYPA